MNTREKWIHHLTRIGGPVLESLAARRLHRDLPLIGAPGCEQDRAKYTHLEAFGRTLCGMAPWLENGVQAEEAETPYAMLPEASPAEARYWRRLAQEAIDAATDPDSPDFLNFAEGQQPIVDAAFLAHAVLRAPTALWEELSDRVKGNLVRALETMRDRKPCFNNWLLFAAVTEAAIRRMTGKYDRMRVDYAIRQHMQWYVGDGFYGDGPDFQWDYYNSFVIQPMLVDLVDAVGGDDPEWAAMAPQIHARAARHAEIQERLISPDGTYPPIGRSLAYRFGAFQLLSQMALQHRLPDGLPPAQVRCALDAVVDRVIRVPGTFDANGWLTIGLCGSQPGIGETYVSTGSLYLCAAAFLPLGLPADDPFWCDPDEEWTQKRCWRGGPMTPDKGFH